MCDGRETPPRTTPVVLLYDQRHVKRDTRTFSKCEAQDQPPRHMSGQEIYIFTNTTCYEVRRKNIRNIRTDLGVYFLNIFKMSECISRDAGHKSSGPSRSCS